MIIACPACKTRYVVPDSAIGVDGRTVRCAKCKHSWFQEGSLELAEATGSRPAAASPASRPQPAHPRPKASQVVPAQAEASPLGPAREAVASPGGGGGVGVAAEATALGDQASPPVDPREDDPRFDRIAPRYEDFSEPAEPGEAGYDEDVSQFAHRPPFRPRRNWVKLASWGAALFAVVALGTVALISTVGLPAWVPVERPLFGVGQRDLKIKFPASEQELRTLPNGSAFFGARIVVSNDARETRAVPPLLIVLRDGRDRVVYSWQVNPPQKSLAPGEAITINEGITDVPKSAVYADIGWAPK